MMLKNYTNFISERANEFDVAVEKMLNSLSTEGYNVELENKNYLGFKAVRMSDYPLLQISFNYDLSTVLLYKDNGDYATIIDDHQISNIEDGIKFVIGYLNQLKSNKAIDKFKL